MRPQRLKKIITQRGAKRFHYRVQANRLHSKQRECEDLKKKPEEKYSAQITHTVIRI